MRIDGSQGGGQILRTALSISALTGNRMEIAKIRAARPKPGLQPQHLMCVNAMAEITGAGVEGNAIGSTGISFSPSAPKPGDYSFDIGTAGSATLLLQCLLPPLLFAGKQSTLNIKGGTDVPFSPPSFFTERVFVKLLERFGANILVKVAKHGFYPKGGGLLHAKIMPSRHLAPLMLPERGKLLEARAVAMTANLPEHVAEREKATLSRRLKGVDVSTKAVSSPSPGNVVFIECEYENVVNGFSSLGAVGKPAEAVAEEAAGEYLAFEGGTDALEHHALDQILLYAALADGESSFKVDQLSEHAQSNLRVMDEMLGTKTEFQNGILTIKGQPV